MRDNCNHSMAMRLFKYTDENGIRIIRDLTIKASRASELNDPFELSPKISASQFTRSKIRKALLHSQWKEGVYRKMKREGKVGNMKEFKRCWKGDMPALVQAVLDPLPQTVESMQSGFAEMFDRHWRLFCVSLRDDSILMWSHYANKHKGLVVEFDTSDPFFGSLPDDSRLEVEYRPEKAEFVLDLNDPKTFKKKLCEVARRKSRDWEKEEEVRFILPAPDDGGCLYRIGPSCITRVILGVRAESGLIRDVRGLLAQPRFAHVNLQQARLAKESFTLEFGSLDSRPS